MKLLPAVFCALLFLSAPALAQVSALSIEAKTTETGLRDGGRFAADVKVRNTGKRELVWTHAQCSGFPASWWTTDKPAFQVVVDEEACRYVKKNPLVDEKLAPGDAVHWRLWVRFTATPADPQQRTASFRLGFKPHSLAASPAEEAMAWSNPIVIPR